MNKIVLTGRMVHTPELKTTPSGVSVCSFTIAVDRQYKQNGEKVADFLDCVAWRNTGEFVAKYFDKGQMIAVAGALETRTYQDRNGNNRKAYEIKVDEADFCGSKQNGTGQAAPAYNMGKQDDFTVIDESSEDLPF